jgi:hypothetical protein
MSEQIFCLRLDRDSNIKIILYNGSGFLSLCVWVCGEETQIYCFALQHKYF